MKKIVAGILFCAIFLAAASLADTRIANDPTRLGVGARVLGMGKSYIGLSDDLLGIYANPAALANVARWQATSMSGKFLNEYNYLNLGAAVPSTYGTFGVGYVGTDIGFTAPSATLEAVDGIRVIPSTTEGSTYNYNNRAVLLSFGRTVYNIPLGATLKFLMVNMSGLGVTNTYANGNELDLGANYKYTPFFKVGLVLQNILPASMGGKVTWQNGNTDSLPHVIKLGSNLKILGEEGWYQAGKHELSLNLDGDFTPLRANLPSLYHLGLEWSPIEFLDVRTGIDQEIVGRGEGGLLDPSNNLTFGVGLYFSDYRFDYAYHQYNQLSENDTHYFSISYGTTKKKKAEIKAPLFTLDPPDKSIVYTAEATVHGATLYEEVKRVALNSAEVTMLKGAFAANVPLTYGKNYFFFQGHEEGWKLIDSQKYRLLRLMTFKDLTEGYWAKLPIEKLATFGIISGFPDGTFQPEGNITRAQMCTLLVKAQSTALTPDPSPSPSTLLGTRGRGEAGFEDVSNKHWAAQYIAQANKLGLVKGYPDKTFMPNGNISRVEGVSILARFAQLPESLTVELPFADLPGRHWAAKEVSAAKQAGILKYLEGKPFEPGKKLTRAEVAEMLARTGPVKAKLDPLTEWEKD